MKKNRPPIQDSPLPKLFFNRHQGQKKRKKYFSTSQLLETPHRRKASSQWRSKPGLYRSHCTWRMRADSASDTTRWAWRAQKRVEPVVPRAMLYYPTDTQSSRLFHWNMIYYLRLQDAHLNRHSCKQPQCECGELTGNRWYGLLSDAIRCRMWRMKIALIISQKWYFV